MLAFSKGGFNDEDELGRFRKAVMSYRDIAKFALFRSPKTYADSKIVIKEFINGYAAFTSHVSITHVPKTTVTLRGMPSPASPSQDVCRA